MKVSELVSELLKMDQDLPVGGIGHFGELLDIQRIYKSDWFIRKEFIVIEIESAGDEPD
jgi:hypothetical protein